MVKIKMCGIKSIDTALKAVNLRVDFLGFVFAESPRQITPKEALKIIKELPLGVAKVGVFVNEEKDRLEEIIDKCSLDYIQLHGEESPEYCHNISAKVIKAIRVQNEDFIKEVQRYTVDMILLDSYNKNIYGGTGQIFNWDLIRRADFKFPFILAGGLTMENINSAISQTNPFAVDVSSGIETNGIKDPGKMEAFVTKVRGASYVA